jgi:hypothetical protein
MKNYLHLYFKAIIARIQRESSSLSLRNEQLLRKYLNLHAWKLFSLALGKVQVSSKLRQFNKFLDIVLKTYRHHGSDYTITYLKNCHVCIQRKLSSNPMHSLRELSPSLPMPRLVNGLPKFIGSVDRAAIRAGDHKTIRYWLTILSVYRVLNAPGKLKLQTITDLWKGNKEDFKYLVAEMKEIMQFNKQFRDITSLEAVNLHRSVASGPNRNIAYLAPIVDAAAFHNEEDTLKEFTKYAELTNSSTLYNLLVDTYHIATALIETKGLFSKLGTSKTIKSLEDLRLGKLAFKQEAAGKVRVFALVDIWTQSLLKPLHKDLFRFLSSLPNDGTFNQDASYQRCIGKAKTSKQCFAFDLSSATDRLPIWIQADIISTMYKCDGLGESWANLLTKRRYIIRSDLFPEVTGHELKYGTGQPMGCLSSWAMLAVTHHFIVQVCAFRVYGTRIWYDNYEVLGDDIVIFDKNIADEYLKVMKALDVGINLSKSLISENLETLEFAKRTSFNGIDVSGLSWKQLLSGNNSQGRTNFALAMTRKGLISKPSMLVRALLSNKYTSFKEAINSKFYRPILERDVFNILGSYALNGIITLKALVAITADPHLGAGGSNWANTRKVPLAMLLAAVTHVSVNKSENINLSSVISQYDRRVTISEMDLTSAVLAEDVIKTALKRLDEFKLVEKTKFKEYMELLVPKFEKILDSDLQKDLQQLCTAFLYKQESTTRIEEAIYNFYMKFGSDSFTLEETLDLSNKIENHIAKFDFVNKINEAKDVGELPTLMQQIIQAEANLSIGGMSVSEGSTVSSTKQLLWF